MELLPKQQISTRLILYGELLVRNVGSFRVVCVGIYAVNAVSSLHQTILESGDFVKRNDTGTVNKMPFVASCEVTCDLRRNNET